MKEQQQQAEQAHRIISKLYLRLTRVPCALVMFTARLRPCHVCPEDGHPFHTPHTPHTPHSRSCWCCVLCAIFGAFPADLCKTVAFFNCIFTRPAGPAVAAPRSCASFASLRFASPLHASLRFYNSSPRVRLVRRMFVQMCAFYTIFTHLRNFAFKCATHCHVDCCCSCSSLLLVYAQPLLSSSPSLSICLFLFGSMCGRQ